MDPQAAAAAAQRTVDLLVLLAGGTAEAGVTEISAPSAPRTIAMAADHPSRVAGVDYGREIVVRRLQEVGCDVYGQDELLVTAPSWRPDLSEPNDLAEEVIRLEGYANLPSTLPTPPSGRGLTDRQRLSRRIGRALAYASTTSRRSATRSPATPSSTGSAWRRTTPDAPRSSSPTRSPTRSRLLRTTLLPGLLGALRRNDGRGSHDLALFETGLVFRPTGHETRAVRLPVDRRPSEDEIAGLDASLPRQPRHAAVVLAGAREQAGWWGKGRPAGWADSVEAARTVAREANVELTVRADRHAPWHPGRCAALYVTVNGEETLLGHAGELHPRVIKELHLPERTSAMEIELDVLERAVDGRVRAPGSPPSRWRPRTSRSSSPTACRPSEIEAALREGAGELLESLRLFDVFTGDQVGEGRKSLAYALRFRAPDRTLTVDEASAARDAAVALAAERTGAVLRGA